MHTSHSPYQGYTGGEHLEPFPPEPSQGLSGLPCGGYTGGADMHIPLSPVSDGTLVTD